MPHDSEIILSPAIRLLRWFRGQNTSIHSHNGSQAAKFTAPKKALWVDRTSVKYIGTACNCQMLRSELSDQRRDLGAGTKARFCPVGNQKKERGNRAQNPVPQWLAKQQGTATSGLQTRAPILHWVMRSKSRAISASCGMWRVRLPKRTLWCRNILALATGCRTASVKLSQVKEFCWAAR